MLDRPLGRVGIAVHPDRRVKNETRAIGPIKKCPHSFFIPANPLCP